MKLRLKTLFLRFSRCFQFFIEVIITILNSEIFAIISLIIQIYLVHLCWWPPYILEKIVNHSSYLKKNCHSFVSLFAHPPVICSSPICHISINTLSCVTHILVICHSDVHQPLTHFPHTTFHSTFLCHFSLGIFWSNFVILIILLLQFLFN